MDSCGIPGIPRRNTDIWVLVKENDDPGEEVYTPLSYYGSEYAARDRVDSLKIYTTDDKKMTVRRVEKLSITRREYETALLEIDRKYGAS